MYTNASEMSALFADSPAPRRIADAVRTKIEKFKVLVPYSHYIYSIISTSRFIYSFLKQSATPA